MDKVCKKKHLPSTRVTPTLKITATDYIKLGEYDGEGTDRTMEGKTVQSSNRSIGVDWSVDIVSVYHEQCF